MKDLPSYEELHRKKKGKVSDKWDAYFNVYNKALESYRYKPVKLLDIGVQNGGSLETWAEFFMTGEKIIGCDINPECAKLKFQDQRIKVHACYWSEYGGGLKNYTSGIEFFKEIIDCINSRSWTQEDKDQVTYINEIATVHGAAIEKKDLDSIESIEFHDSICIIRKVAAGSTARIKERVIKGSEEGVLAGLLNLSGLTLETSKDQSAWKSTLKLSQELEICEKKLEICEQKIKEQWSELEKFKKEKERQNLELAKINKAFEEIRNSNSWRITQPLRLMSEKLKAKQSKQSRL